MIEIDISKELSGATGKMELKVNLKIKEGDFVALSGESGSGKTTLLRIISGLEKAKGSIKVNNKIWQDKKFFLPVQKRGIGYLFQNYALFSNMTVLQNLLFVKKDIKFAKELLDITGLTELKDRYPSTLSGGQQQRVSLCRAFMNKPKLLLLDEPLSALDPKIREKLQNDILILHKKFKTTTIMVSHDISEIYKLSNRIIELYQGKIIKDIDNKNDLVANETIEIKAKIIDILKNTNEIILSNGQRLFKIKNQNPNLKINQQVQIISKPIKILK